MVSPATVTLDDIHAAAERLAPVLRRTPVEHVHAVSTFVGRDVWVKEEQLQRAGSYKIRGTYNLITQLPEGIEVVAGSAGNHAQATALAAKLTSHPCKVFMPQRAPLPKVEATETYGASIELVAGDAELCRNLAMSYAESTGAAFVPIFDHPEIIAGNGTLGLELAQELPSDIKTVVVPVGGGGLIAGVAVALKALRPEIRIVGVEASGAPAMTRSLREGHPVRLDAMHTMADAIATREVSELTFQHVKRFVDEMVLVTEGELSHAILVLLERAKAVIEPGAAAALAGVMAGEIIGNDSVACVLTGGNVDPVMLVKLIDHGLTSSGRYVVVRVVMPDTPGQLSGIARIVSEMGVNIVDIENHRSGHFIEADQIELDLTLETRNRRQQDELVDALCNGGFQAEIVN